LATLAPPLKGASTSTPSTGEGILLYIFIASKTRTVSPCLTGSPGFFSYLMNIPGIGAVILVPPSELATGAGFGSEAGLEVFIIGPGLLAGFITFADSELWGTGRE